MGCTTQTGGLTCIAGGANIKILIKNILKKEKLNNHCP